MLQLGVHCAGIISTIACYWIGTIIPDCDCQHGISYYHIYRLRLCVSDMDRFCWVNFSLRFFAWVRFMVRLIGEFAVLQLFARNLVLIFDWYSVPETCVGTWIFDWELGLETWIFNWDSHICRDGHVFTTAKLLLNNVLYHQWFIVINFKLIIKWNLI